MAVDIYEELLALRLRQNNLSASLAAAEVRLTALETPPVVPPRMRLGVVSYFRPSSGQWEPTLAAKPALTMINPGSGPGPSVDAAYPPQVVKCKAAGVPVFGYVHSKGADGIYGNRPLAEVKADIDKHIAWYGVTGIFVDCTSTDRAKLPYYTELCAYIHAKGLQVCLNPGSAGPEEHADMADYVMVAENYWVRYKLQVPPAWWLKPIHAGKLWHVMHACPAADLQAAVDLARSRGAGLVYPTDDVMPNPYNLLPSYFGALVAAVG